MAATTETQDGANIRALAMTIQPASAGMTIAECELALGSFVDSTGTFTLPAGWSAATVLDGNANAVANTPFTTVAAASLPDVNDPNLLNGLIAFNPTTFADLATLKADGTQGDGNYAGGNFTTDQYVILGDGSVAHFTAAAWAAGAAA